MYIDPSMIYKKAKNMQPYIEIAGLCAVSKDPKLEAIGLVLGVSLAVTSIKKLLRPSKISVNNPYTGNRIETKNGLTIQSPEEACINLLEQLEKNKRLEKEDRELFKLLGMYIKDWAPTTNYEQIYNLLSLVRISYAKPKDGNYALCEVDNYHLNIPKNEKRSQERMLKLHEIMHGILYIPEYPCLDEGIVVLITSHYWNNGLPVYNYNYSTMITALISTLINPTTMITAANCATNKPIVEKLAEIVGSKEKAEHLLNITNKYYETYRKQNLLALKAKRRKIDIEDDPETIDAMAELSKIRKEFTEEFKQFADIQIERGILDSDYFDYSQGCVLLRKPFSFYDGEDIYINGILKENLDKKNCWDLLSEFNYDSILVHRILAAMSKTMSFDVLKERGIVIKDPSSEDLIMMSKDELVYILAKSEKEELSFKELGLFLASERKRIQEKKERNHSQYKTGTRVLNPEIEKLASNLGLSEKSSTDFITKLDSTTCIYKNNSFITIKSSEFDENGMFYIAEANCKIETLKTFIAFAYSTPRLQSIPFHMMSNSLSAIENGTFNEELERTKYMETQNSRQKTK